MLFHYGFSSTDQISLNSYTVPSKMFCPCGEIELKSEFLELKDYLVLIVRQLEEVLCQTTCRIIVLCKPTSDKNCVRKKCFLDKPKKTLK